MRRSTWRHLEPNWQELNLSRCDAIPALAWEGLQVERLWPKLKRANLDGCLGEGRVRRLRLSVQQSNLDIPLWEVDCLLCVWLMGEWRDY